MTKSLVVVESPAKAKTIKKYLGKDYEVAASVGHIKDLPAKEMGVDVENDFKPSYVLIRGKGKILQEIKSSSKKVDQVFLAPDPDREGEAIAWHIAEEIRGTNPHVFRVLFNEITQSAIEQAIRRPLDLNQNKFESQQARRILDRLVGYTVSPLLWDKVRRGLSAGRVQSVAVRIIVEREREILAFVPREYWTIAAFLNASTPPQFKARLVKIDGKKATIPDKAAADGIVHDLTSETFVVSSVEKTEKRRDPQPPFITSKIQQEAARRFHFSAKLTMSLAQKLYEGIDIGEEGSVGLITYMRTDSTRLSEDSIQQARSFIEKTMGPDFVPSKPRLYKNAKGSQDAHEAIRPTSLDYAPERVKAFLTRDQFRLYQLIWNRFIASQMKSARYDQTSVEIQAGKYLFRAVGTVMTFPGFTALWKDVDTNGNEGQTEEQVEVPDVKEKETLRCADIEAAQKFTQPPARFTESTLVRELEEKGIGRPSTYATIISTIQDKKYVEKKEGKFYPTELGSIVTDLLVAHFPDLFNVAFTARMEDTLDDVEDGKANWLGILKDFYGSFKGDVEKAKEQMRNVKREEVPTDIVCTKCGSTMVIKFGRNGSFLACSNYPDCKNTAEFERNEKGQVVMKQAVEIEKTCAKCGSPLVMKRGRFGRFLACKSYPQCNYTESITTGVPCPRENCKGHLTERTTKKGRVFYSCSTYPKCDYALWDRPIAEACPQCGHPFLVERLKRGSGIGCPECKYTKKSDS